MRLLSEVLLICLAFYMMSCSESEYSTLVEQELKKEVRKDSIFLTFEFGDLREEFFSKGWQLNKKGLVMQGPGNRTVQYTMQAREQGASPVRMLFYPKFDSNDRIKEMEVTFDYTAWAPWTNRFSSDSLLLAVQDTLMTWYGGNNFIKVTTDDGTNEYLLVKVDGNRRIVIHKKDEKDVYGRISDLTHEEVMKKDRI